MLDRVYDEVENCSIKFHEKFDLSVEFTEGASDEIVRRLILENEDPDKIWDMISKDFEYGLKLIKEKTGRSRFTINRAAIKDPESFLNDLITDLFQMDDELS